jgi:hypothetical protein
MLAVNAFRTRADIQLGDEVLPDDMPETWTDEQLKALHHVLMEVRSTTYLGNQS